MPPFSKIAILLSLCLVQISASAHEQSSILNVRFFPCSNIDLTAVGTHDWVVFGRGLTPQDIRDSKTNGRGLNRTIRITGQAQDIQKQTNTRLSYFWSVGQQRPQGEHGTRENSAIDGVSITVAPGGRIRFSFEGSGLTP